MTFPAPATDSGDPRVVLERLVRERGEDYAALSRMLGKNAAYVQQFIKRGTPRRLGERERAILASYFRIDEALLGAPVRSAAVPVRRGLRTIPRYDIGAAAGAGGLEQDERTDAHFAFDEDWLRDLSPHPQRLAIIRVEGDSMLPTLNHGDDIMVDSADDAMRLRDGIYVLRRDGLLLVKRLACSAARGRVAIVSDNPAYPTEADVRVGDLDVVGRVLWAGRRL